MVANTGTYVDSPFHRFADGTDIAGLDLDRLADLPAIVVRATGMSGPGGRRPPRRALRWPAWRLAGAADPRRDRLGRRPLGRGGLLRGHPFLTEGAAQALVAADAASSASTPTTSTTRPTADAPVHTTLLGAGIPIVEHLWRLGELPLVGARFSAVPAPIRGMGTFPVRAYAAIVDG